MFEPGAPVQWGTKNAIRVGHVVVDYGRRDVLVRRGDGAQVLVAREYLSPWERLPAALEIFKRTTKGEP